MAGPCMIIGALHGGQVANADYIRAKPERVMAIQESIACVEIIEAENISERSHGNRHRGIDASQHE